MRFCLNTDCLGYMPFEEMLDTVAALGYESIEIACGNWSKAPHIDLDAMLASEETRKNYMDAIAKRGLVLEVLNCSGNQLAPNEEGKQHQEVVEKTFKLAGLLGIKKIVMMSGCPGGSAEDHTPNWIVTSWPPITTRILNWQWEEVLIPYWKKTVELAKANGIDKIALENHGCQMVYNPETLIRLRDAVGPMVGMNLDPSHLMWMGGDPVTAVHKLGADRIYHVHAKDVRMERNYIGPDGVLDQDHRPVCKAHLELRCTRSRSRCQLVEGISVLPEHGGLRRPDQPGNGGPDHARTDRTQEVYRCTQGSNAL